MPGSPVPGCDDDAWIRAVYPSLRRLAAVVAPAELEPDDLVQDALARVIGAGRLDQVDDVGAYLRRTIVNLAANERRRLGRRRRALRRVAPAIDTGALAYPSDVDELFRLAPVARAVLYLAHVEGRMFAEVGELVRLTETAARTQASRARRRLRHLLNEEDTA